jgi:hypothetical protein
MSPMSPQHAGLDRFDTLTFIESVNVNTLWLFNIAVVNSPFIDEFPIKTSIYKGFSMAMLNNPMVSKCIQKS